MNKILNIEQYEDVSFLIVSNKEEAIALILSGFLTQQTQIRLFFMEKENEWLLAGELWERFYRKTYVNAGASADYV